MRNGKAYQYMTKRSSDCMRRRSLSSVTKIIDLSSNIDNHLKSLSALLDISIFIHPSWSGQMNHLDMLKINTRYEIEQKDCRRYVAL